MDTIFDMQERWRAFDLVGQAADIIEANKDAMIGLNRAQLLAGLNNRGEFLSPKYSEDPWFKSRESAERYARKKQQMFPDTPYDVPNLIISGAFHRGISLMVNDREVIFEDSVSFAAAITAKYKDTALGLNRDSKDDAMDSIIHPSIMDRLERNVGVKIS